MTSDQLAKTFSESYVIHFWNRLSKNTTVEVGSNQVYGVLANKFCPGIYHNCGKFFEYMIFTFTENSIKANEYELSIFLHYKKICYTNYEFSISNYRT